MRTWRRALAVGAVVVTVAAALSSCARPEFQYERQVPGDAPAGTVYFKVPQGWSPFPAKQIASAQEQWTADATAKSLLDATAWQTAYDASIQPSLGNVLGTGSTDQPTLYASLRSLYDAEKADASALALRDMVVPVSKLGSSVDITTDQAVTQGRARGVHLVFSYDPGSGLPRQTVDQTAFLSDGNDAVYLLLVRCSSVCYDNHRDEISTVTSSYTIQESGRG